MKNAKKILGKILVLVLLVAAISITTVTIESCQKANAQTTAVLNQKGIILYAKLINDSLVEGNYGGYTYWTSNYDGSNNTQVPIQFPNGIIGVCPYPKLSPDGQSIFFSAVTGIGSGVCYIYSCSISGGNPKIILQTPNQNLNGGQFEIGGAY